MMFVRILQNIFILISVYGYYCIRGSATHVPKKLQNILITPTAKMGDMVCSTPVMHALRVQFPSARITVLGDSIGKQILADNKDVNDYIVSSTSFFNTLRVIRREHFDASIVLVPDSRAVALSFLGNARFIVAPEVVNGYCPWQTKTYRILRRLVQSMPHRMKHYAPGEYLKLLEPLGIHTNDTKKHLSYSDKESKDANAFLLANNLTEKKFAIISPSAGNKIKNWPANRFACVAEHIVSKGLSVVVIGGSRDVEEVSEMMRHIKKPKDIINALGKVSVGELKALIAQSALFVSVDTGPIYIAEAFGVATVDIVGPMDEREQPPRGERHIVVIPQRTEPAVHIMNARMYDKDEAHRQVEDISVKMVCDNIDSLI